MVLTKDFDFDLPQELIAHEPVSEREKSKLMVLDRQSQLISHNQFENIGDYLDSDTVLVLNNTKVFNARVYAHKVTGARVELLLLNQEDTGCWTCLARPSKRLKKGDKLTISDTFSAEVIEKDVYVTLQFSSDQDIYAALSNYGEPPLPPYITVSDPHFFQERYQTVYAKHTGSIAAPTAGLHFSESLLGTIKNKGVSVEYITLHVGYGTFKPITATSIADHELHSETFIIEPAVASRLNAYKKSGKKIISVGTTTTRALEAVHNDCGRIQSGTFDTNLFIYPGYSFGFIDSMITNFHLPKSSLLVLVSTLAGQGFIKKAYQEAIDREYRFYSFGDAMLIL